MSHSKQFTDQELGCRDCGVNRTTKLLVDALEELRSVIGEPIIVHDAYRCTAHNTAVCGEPNSRHLTGNAADIEVEGMDARTLYSFIVKVPSIRGVGVSDKHNFVHVDIRTESARWCYDTNGRSCKWYDRTPQLSVEASGLIVEDRED